MHCILCLCQDSRYSVAMSLDLHAWSVSEGNFPAQGTLVDKLAFFVRYATLAPSTYNTQPWLFKIGEDFIDVFADRRYGLAVLDPDDRELILSCGSAIYALRLTIRHFGYQEETTLLPDEGNDDLLARIKVSGSGDALGDPLIKELFPALGQRTFNRKVFKNKPVPADHLSVLKQVAADEKAWLHICDDEQKENVASLVADGDQIQMSKKAFRREYALWVDDLRTYTNDGYPAYAQGFSETMKTRKGFALRRFENEQGSVADDDELMSGCPTLAVLGSDKGGDLFRLRAGQALMKVLLKAQTLGLSVSMLNQPCEVPELRLRLHDAIDHYHARAHCVFRIGYATPIKHFNPRRSLDKVILFHNGVRPSQDEAFSQNSAKVGFFASLGKLFVAK